MGFVLSVPRESCHGIFFRHFGFALVPAWRGISRGRPNFKSSPTSRASETQRGIPFGGRRDAAVKADMSLANSLILIYWGVVDHCVHRFRGFGILLLAHDLFAVGMGLEELWLHHDSFVGHLNILSVVLRLNSDRAGNEPSYAVILPGTRLSRTSDIRGHIPAGRREPPPGAQSWGDPGGGPGTSRAGRCVTAPVGSSIVGAGRVSRKIFSGKWPETWASCRRGGISCYVAAGQTQGLLIRLR